MNRKLRNPQDSGYITPESKTIEIVAAQILCESGLIESLTVEDEDPFNWV